MPNSSAATPTKSILIIGSGELLNRLPESFATENLSIDVFDLTNSVLRKSSFIRNFLVLDKKPNEAFHKAVFRNRAKLASLNYDYYLFADDWIAIELARKSKDHSLQLKLLPVRKPEGIKFTGSKVGFVQVCQESSIEIPRSKIAKSEKELVEFSSEFSSDFLVKADIGGGGSTVKRFTERLSGSDAKELKAWLPVVIQEEIVGPLISVEAIFDSGKLLGWTYSKFDVESWEFGPSTRRTFLDPPSLDFELTLQELGNATGFHGLANASFIWNEQQQRHYMFEADTRPNGWHQFGKRLGVDFGSLFLNSEAIHEPVRQNLSGKQVTFSLFPREPQYAINTGKWGPVWFWLKRSPGTWEARNHLDPAINKAEAREIRTAIKHRLNLKYGKPFRFIKRIPRLIHLGLAKTFVWGWQSLPDNTRARFEKVGVKKLLVLIFRV